MFKKALFFVLVVFVGVVLMANVSEAAVTQGDDSSTISKLFENRCTDNVLDVGIRVVRKTRTRTFEPVTIKRERNAELAKPVVEVKRRGNKQPGPAQVVELNKKRQEAIRPAISEAENAAKKTKELVFKKQERQAIRDGQTKIDVKTRERELKPPAYAEKRQRVAEPKIKKLLPLEAAAEVGKRNFEWQYEDTKYQWTLEIPKKQYDANKSIHEIMDRYFQCSMGEQQQVMLKEMPQELKDLIKASTSKARGNLIPWVVKGSRDEYIKQLANQLKAQARANNYDRFETAEFVLSFVQAIPYEKRLYPQLPVKTLKDGGDCDCKTVLLSAILENMGYETALLYYSSESKGSESGHLSLGIYFADSELPERGYPMSYYKYNGTRYYTAETSKDFLIGYEIPFEVTEIYPLT